MPSLRGESIAEEEDTPLFARRSPSPANSGGRWLVGIGVLILGALAVSHIVVSSPDTGSESSRRLKQQPRIFAGRRGQQTDTDPTILRIATWNIAAINNNPFEYWITHDDVQYNRMMQDVQQFLDTPGEADVAVGSLLTNEMLSELRGLMVSAGWPMVDEAVAEWQAHYAQRKIINGFMKDKGLGKKRLMSMPDRTTNTINLASGGTANRPTVINCYNQQFGSLAEFWQQWTKFMFGTKLDLASGKSTTPSGLVGKISRAKYPALTEEEEAMSRPLSTICQAAFDLILVHMLDTIGGGAHKAKWQPMRQDMCSALNSRKSQRTLGILSRAYRDSDVIFLQEVSSAMVGSLRSHPFFEREYSIFVAPNDGKRDQISLALLSKKRFDPNSVKPLTASFDELLVQAGGKVPVAPGDVLAMSATDVRSGKPFLLASFHGDTDGLATVPVVQTMTRLAEKHFGSSILSGSYNYVFGMDANTYAVGSKKQQGVAEFATEFKTLGLTSCWGDSPDPNNITTFNARTYLQPQLNKAVAFRDLEAPGTGDKNPKDFILFNRNAFTVSSTVKDNTGKKHYVEKQPFPTLTFPSDHGILSTVLKVL